MPEITLYTPHPNQAKIHEAINEGPYKYYTANIGRQFGKSLLGENQNLYWMINYPGCVCGWVSPTFRQAQKVYDEIIQAFDGSGLLKTNAQKMTITLGKSSLQFFSAERYDNMRGFTFNYLTCDEFAYYDPEAWTKVLKPTVLVKGQKVLFLSTPRGKNHFYTIHQLDGVNAAYKSFTMTSYDNPYINPEEIEEAKQTLPDHIFRQEYLAEFVDGGAGLFNGVEYRDHEDKGDRNYAGVDVGRAEDYTVLSVFNDKGQQIYVERWRHDSWANITSKVADRINEFDAMTFVEVNGVGDPVYEQIKQKVNNSENVRSWVTSTKSKKDIVEDLAIACQNQDIVLKDCDWLRKEFEVFTYEYNPKSKVIKYGAPVGFHDDGVMSTAIAHYSYKHGKSLGVYSIV